MCTRAGRQGGALAGLTTEFALPLAGTSDHHPADRRPATTEGPRRTTVNVHLITGVDSQIVVGTAVAAVAVAAVAVAVIRARKAHTTDSDRDSALFIQWLTIPDLPYSGARLYFEYIFDIRNNWGVGGVGGTGLAPVLDP